MKTLLDIGGRDIIIEHQIIVTGSHLSPMYKHNINAVNVYIPIYGADGSVVSYNLIGLSCGEILAVAKKIKEIQDSEPSEEDIKIYKGDAELPW